MRYIETIILINVLIHLSIIGITNFILKQKASYICIGVSVIIDIIYVYFYLLYPYEIEEFRYLIILAISFLPFGLKKLVKSLLSTLLYLIINFSLGGMSGALFVILNHYTVVLISLFILLLSLTIVIVYKKVKFKLSNLMYEIVILDDGKRYFLEGYCDTGNFLNANDNIPIIFVNKRIKIGKYKNEIIINSLSTKKKIRIYTVDDFKIKINDRLVSKDVYIAYGNIKYDIMFGLDLLGG